MSKVVNKKISRIVKQKIILPEGVVYSRNGEHLFFKGPDGEVRIFFHKDIIIKENDNCIFFSSDTLSMSILGTFVMLFKNTMNGVFKKFEKTMNLYGVGYKVIGSENELEFFVGYSHSIKVVVPNDIEFEIKTPTQVVLRCCSNARLGDFAAKISRLRKVNPYKTKGIIEEGSFILKKEGKK